MYVSEEALLPRHDFDQGSLAKPLCFASPRCFPYTTACLLDGLVLGLCYAGHSGWSLVCQVDVNPHPYLPQGHAPPQMGVWQ